MRSCLTKLYEQNAPPSVPLFGHHARDILSCLEKMDVKLPGARDPEYEVWTWMKERVKLSPVTSRRTHMSQFSSASYSLIKHVGSWAICEFETTYCCLEMDFLGSTKLTKLLKSNLGADAAGADGGGDGAVGAVSDTSIDEKLIRASSANAVVIGYQMYSNGTNRRYFSSLAELARLEVGFHTEQNRDTRSSQTTHDWYLKQVDGGFIKHVSELMGVLHDPIALARADFAILDEDIDALGDDVHSEDLFADFLAQATNFLAGNRQRRNLGLVRGWKKRLLLLKTPRADECMKEFKGDHDINVHLKGLKNKSKKLELVLGRDLFEKEDVKQHVRIAERMGWRASDEQRTTLTIQTSGLLQTQLIEDVIGSQKNDSSTQAVNKYKRPMAAMASALQSEIIDNRHQFNAIEVDLPLAKKRRLQDVDFKADIEKQTLEFEQISNYEQKTSFWSPKAENNNVP